LENLPLAEGALGINGAFCGLLVESITGRGPVLEGSGFEVEIERLAVGAKRPDRDGISSEEGREGSEEKEGGRDAWRDECLGRTGGTANR
jgi:hypothetical protein